MALNSRQGIIEIGVMTVVVSLVTFLSTGVYNMFKITKNVPQTTIEHANIQSLQDKYCNINNPTPQQQQLCIEALKLSIPVRK